MQIPASVFFYPSIFLYGYYALHSPPSPHPLCSHNPPSLGNSVLNALEKCMGYAKEIIVLRCPNTHICRVHYRLIQSGFSHVFVVHSKPIEIVCAVVKKLDKI